MIDCVKYKHHGVEVFVKRHLKGRHQEFCLCYCCGKFKPGMENNCFIAQAVYKNCVVFNIVTPMWECPEFDNGMIA